MRLMLKSLLNDIYGITFDKQKSQKPCIFLPRLKRRKMQPLVLGSEIKKEKGGGYLSGVKSPKYLVILDNGKWIKYLIMQIFFHINI